MGRLTLGQLSTDCESSVDQVSTEIDRDVNWVPIKTLITGGYRGDAVHLCVYFAYLVYFGGTIKTKFDRMTENDLHVKLKSAVKVFLINH